MDLLTPKLEMFAVTDLLFDDSIHCDENESSTVTRRKISRVRTKKTHKVEQKASKKPVKKYKKKRQVCSICSVSYSKREYLSKHMISEHNVVLEKKPPGRQSAFRVPGHTDDPRPYKCDQCLKEYVKSKHLARHRRTHLETRHCIDCNLTYHNYADHMLKKHGIELPRPFECDICKKTYRTKSNIQSHMRIHRANSKIFACTVCSKAFSFATDMRKHMRTHSLDRSMICDICGDAFKSSDTLKCHMRRHTGERPYKCSQCPRAFSTSNSLDIHFRTHTGERPFQCEFCEKRFSDSSTLYVHKRLHTNENPYMCHLCGRRTKQASNLRSHYKHFHKNNDITGRQVRLNSRIFNRFSQSEIDAELQQVGDLMALLERGLQEFDREEKEKNSQIQKALEVINKPIELVQSTFLIENSAKVEINPPEAVEVKVKEENHASNSQLVREIGNTSISIVKFNQKSTRKTRAQTKANLQASKKSTEKKSEDVEDMQSPNSLGDGLIYDTVALPVKKGLIKIESVFIDDSTCRQSETEHFPIEHVKREENSDYDDNWANDHFNDFSNEPFPDMKFEPITDTPKPTINDISNTPTKTDEIKPIDFSESEKEDDEMKTTGKVAPKAPRPKIEMERCRPCNRKFHDMPKHWVECHSGIERPYECYICRRYYKRFEHLKYHIKTHGDERDYVCHVCGDAFFLSNELRKHIMYRHQVERPFKCTFQQCKKCFKNQHALNVHMRTHSGIKPYICAVCSDAFTALSSLKIHERKHTNAKPYVCKFCKKAFADCSTHKQHVRIHTGEKPYKCHLCDRRTAQAGNLKSHYRHYHKIIVKSVSMYMNVGNSQAPLGQEVQRNPYERSHDISSYHLMNPSQRIEE